MLRGQETPSAPCHWLPAHCCAGYKFNIVFLRNFLAPIYEIWDIKQNPDNEWEMLVRWTFTMQFWFNRWLPSKVLHLWHVWRSIGDCTFALVDIWHVHAFIVVNWVWVLYTGTGWLQHVCCGWQHV